MTNKSHLKPGETKKTNLCRISLGHESTASGVLTDLQQPSLFYYDYHYPV